MKEPSKRSIVKTISWRVLATFTTMVIVYIFTNQLMLSLGIGFFELLSKMLLYYGHERVWAGISWGRPDHPLSKLPVNQELAPEDVETVKKLLKDLGYL